MKKVLIKKLNSKAVTPKKRHNDDFCYDVVATSCEEIAPHVYKYGTGIALQYPRKEKEKFGERGAVLSIALRARSSVWKTGMVLSNSIGTIDQGYTGEISAVFYHVLPNMPKYEVGDRIAQIHFNAAMDLQFVEVQEFLYDTDRGNDSYGSTGK